MVCAAVRVGGPILGRSAIETGDAANAMPATLPHSLLPNYERAMPVVPLAAFNIFDLRQLESSVLAVQKRIALQKARPAGRCQNQG
jgi:hypothetical protein